jgi:hypothetical protein
MCMCMGLRLWVGVNVVVKLLVGVEVWVRSRRWLMVCVLIRRLWVVGVVVGHDGRRVWLWRREGWTIMSAPTAARCARVMPVVERGCRSGDWVRTRVRGWRWTFLRVRRGTGQIWTCGVGVGEERKRPVQGRLCYRGQDGDHVRGHRGGHRAPWRMWRTGRGRCATGGAKGVRGEDERMEWGDGLAGWEIASRKYKAHHYIERIVDSTR